MRSFHRICGVQNFLCIKFLFCPVIKRCHIFCCDVAFTTVGQRNVCHLAFCIILSNKDIAKNGIGNSISRRLALCSSINACLLEVCHNNTFGISPLLHFFRSFSHKRCICNVCDVAVRRLNSPPVILDLFKETDRLPHNGLCCHFCSKARSCTQTAHCEFHNSPFI